MYGDATTTPKPKYDLDKLARQAAERMRETEKRLERARAHTDSVAQYLKTLLRGIDKAKEDPNV